MERVLPTGQVSLPIQSRSVISHSPLKCSVSERLIMESVLSPVGSGFFCHTPASSKRRIVGSHFNSCSFAGGVHGGGAPKRIALVKAEGVGINPDIRKSEEKVVDSVVVTELSKPLTPYCRCWRSGTFPLCDGSHVKHNKATGDNVGPLLLKK